MLIAILIVGLVLVWYSCKKQRNFEICSNKTIESPLCYSIGVLIFLVFAYIGVACLPVWLAPFVNSLSKNCQILTVFKEEGILTALLIILSGYLVRFLYGILVELWNTLVPKIKLPCCKVFNSESAKCVISDDEITMIFVAACLQAIILYVILAVSSKELSIYHIGNYIAAILAYLIGKFFWFDTTFKDGIKDIGRKFSKMSERSLASFVYGNYLCIVITIQKFCCIYFMDFIACILIPAILLIICIEHKNK